MTATPATTHLIQCCHCSQPLTLRHEHLGQPIQCPYCHNYFQAEEPPPPPADEPWFVQLNGRRVGPISSKGLARLAANGKLLPDMWLTRGISEFWMRAARIKGLRFRRKADAVRPGEHPVPAATKDSVKKDLVTCACPYCERKCLIPQPTTPMVFTCPGCQQPFRAATTSGGVVCQRTTVAHQNTVHQGAGPTRFQ